MPLLVSDPVPIPEPTKRPHSPYFSSGPCCKPDNFSYAVLQGATLGRSHRAPPARAKLAQAIDRTKSILAIPNDYSVAIVPASNTGAYEMALWSLLGAHPVEALAWESFGQDWLYDLCAQLSLTVHAHTADYGDIPDLNAINFNNDVCFVWNGTTSGVCLENGDFIPKTRIGLTICDATSAAFAVDLPWDKLDVTTFSWQKALGGEAAHGMLVLSPRALYRLDTHTPPWPVPKVFRLTNKGKINNSLFTGATINTPSMLCVEDYLNCLNWAEQQGGLSALIARTRTNANVVDEFVQQHDWIDFLACDARYRSPTSVCLKLTDAAVHDNAGLSKAIVDTLATKAIAYDIAAYRTAPSGLRLWCGATIATQDLHALMPWIEWAYHTHRTAYCHC